MKIYLIYRGWDMVALTVDKEQAARTAKIYNACVQEYDDVKDLPQTPMWGYATKDGICEQIMPYEVGDRGERVEDYQAAHGGKHYVAEVYADDEAHARKKAHEMIAQYIAGKEGIT